MGAAEPCCGRCSSSVGHAWVTLPPRRHPVLPSAVARPRRPRSSPPPTSTLGDASGHLRGLADLGDRHLGAVASSLVSMAIRVPYQLAEGARRRVTRPAASKCGAHRTGYRRDRPTSAPDSRWPRLRSDGLSPPDGLEMGHAVVTTVNRSTERSPSQGQGRQRGQPDVRGPASFISICGSALPLLPQIMAAEQSRKSQLHHRSRRCSAPQSRGTGGVRVGGGQRAMGFPEPAKGQAERNAVASLGAQIGFLCRLFFAQRLQI